MTGPAGADSHTELPRTAHVRRPARFLLAAGQIRLDRFHADPAGVKTCLRVLRDGLTVGIFPEGSRGSGTLERFHRGAAYFALVTGAPVVPVTLFGTREPGAGSNALPRRGAVVRPESIWSRASSDSRVAVTSVPPCSALRRTARAPGSALR